MCLRYVLLLGKNWKVPSRQYNDMQENAHSQCIVCLLCFLGKHKGTPSLRNGIHCVRIEPEEDEESDWQGF